MYVNAACPPFRLSLYETFSAKGGLFMMGSQSPMTYKRETGRFRLKLVRAR